MRLYRCEPVPRGKALFYLLEKRRNKKTKRFVYVCIAIVSGRKNTQNILESLNR